MSRLSELLTGGKAPTVLEHSPRRPAGYVQISDPESGITDRETLQCCHCQAHWIVRPGSGIERSFCFKCSAITCGGPDCIDRCVPFEKMIEEIESKARIASNIEAIRRS